MIGLSHSKKDDNDHFFILKRFFFKESEKGSGVEQQNLLAYIALIW